MLSLDPSSLITIVATSLALLLGLLVLVRKAASKYFVVDARFDHGEGFGSIHRMSIGGGGGGGGGEGSGSGEVCAACGGDGAKKCSRCKGVYYCSQECQSKHWPEHKLNCKLRLSDKVDHDDTSRWKKSPGLSSISLMLPRGKCKVLKKPKKILFPYEEFVNLFNWDKPGIPPCGLLNCGNSCFANVVLQCLTCTRPLAAYLLENEHSRACIRRQEDWCFLCELEDHVHRASENRQPFSPTKILSRIPNIGGNLGYGSQEDAHELMRFAIDTMQSVCLDEYGGEKAVDSSTQETTLVQHIFGGHLQSQVICTKCNMVSNRYENMMDLTVEIHGDADSLEECLNQFTVKEWLDGDNMYKCDGCNDYVKACKRLTVHQAPNILTVTLKRFQRGRFGKLNKRVSFPEELDLTPYMGDAADGSDLYSLYAVVVHLDMLNASFFGHYICYTKDHYGRWYRIDDCKVTAVDVDEVLSQGAYMLLYSRRTPRKKHLAVGDVNSSNVPTAENVTRDHTNLSSLSTLCQSNPALLRDTGHDRQKSKTDYATEIKDIMESEEIVEVHERQNGKTDDATEIKYILESEEPVEGNPVRKGVSAEDMGNSELVTSVMTKDSEEGKSSRFLHNQDNAVTFNNPIDAGIITGTLCPVAVQPIEYEPDAETHVEVNRANDVAEGISSSSGDTSDVSLAISNSSGDTADVSLSGSNIAESVSKSSSSASFTSSSTEPEEAFQNRLELKAEEKPATVAHNHPGSTTNVIHKMEEVFSNRSEIKAEQKPAMVPHNHLRSTTNGVCRLEEAFSNRSELKAEEKPATVAALNWLGSTTNGVHKPEEAFPNRSELKAEAKPGTKPLGSTTNGVQKPKPLFSRGFLDRDSSAAKKSVDNVKKIQKERSEANTPIGSGHSNGYSEIKFDKLKNEKVNGDGSAKPVSETEASTSNGNGKVKGTVTDFNGQNKENASNVSKELALGEFANGGNHNGKFYFQLKQFSPEMFPQNENGANFAKPTGLVSTLVDGEYNYGKS